MKILKFELPLKLRQSRQNIGYKLSFFLGECEFLVPTRIFWEKH